jgi:UDP-N-acetylglucosamine:LPS N-acetylglucosamine transferase
MKICLAASAGGHLKEILQLKPLYNKHSHYFITMKRADSKALSTTEKVYFLDCPSRNPIKFIINVFQSFDVLRKENPDLVISTGADVSLATCCFAKMLGKKVIYIESFCRPLKPSITGRLVYPIADLFLYQWKEVGAHYPKGKYAGSIF